MTPLVVFEVAGLWTAAAACGFLVWPPDISTSHFLITLVFVFLGLVALLAGVAVLV